MQAIKACNWCQKTPSFDALTSCSCLRATSIEQNFHGIELPALLDEFGSNSLAAHFCLLRLSLYAGTSRFSEPPKDRSDGPGDHTPHHCFCTSARMETARCVIEGLVAEVASRERLLPLLKEPNIVFLISLDRSLTQLSLLSSSFIEALERQCWYHIARSSHRLTESDPMTGDLAVSVHQNTDFSVPLLLFQMFWLGSQRHHLHCRQSQLWRSHLHLPIKEILPWWLLPTSI